MIDETIELRVRVIKNFGGFLVLIDSDPPVKDEMFERGSNPSIGQAFADAYTRYATKLAFNGMDTCRICCRAKATMVSLWKRDDAEGFQIRCEACVRLSANPEHFKPLPVPPPKDPP